MVKWIFFDVGSTLVDETKAYAHQVRDMLSGTPITVEQFEAMRLAFAQAGLDGHSAAIKHLGLEYIAGSLRQAISSWYYCQPEARNCAAPGSLGFVFIL